MRSLLTNVGLTVCLAIGLTPLSACIGPADGPYEQTDREGTDSDTAGDVDADTRNENDGNSDSAAGDDTATGGNSNAGDDTATGGDPNAGDDTATGDDSNPGGDTATGGGSGTDSDDTTWEDNSMGFIGCSMAENVAQGYVAVGGKRMWGPYNTNGLVVQDWTNTNSSGWGRFDQQANRFKKPTAVWVQLCIFSWAGVTYDETKTLIANAREHAAEGATIFITGQPIYEAGAVCSLAGADGPALTEDMAKKAAADASQNVIYPGPFGPLGGSTSSDGCHANVAGQKLLGEQALEYFGG